MASLKRYWLSIGSILSFFVISFALIACMRAKSGDEVNKETQLVGSQIIDLMAYGIHVTDWQPSSSPGYEVAYDLDHLITLFGVQGIVSVVRRGDTIAAIDFQVSACTEVKYNELRQKIIEAFQLEDQSDRDIYVVLSSGVVHLSPYDGNAHLVLTDAIYGEIYVQEMLRKGFMNLSNAFRPH